MFIYEFVICFHMIQVFETLTEESRSPMPRTIDGMDGIEPAPAGARYGRREVRTFDDYLRVHPDEDGPVITAYMK